MLTLTLLLAAVAAVLLLPTASDLVSLGRALSERRRRPERDAASPPHVPDLLFLVPAHDEELLIDACVRSLVHQQYPHAHFAVVVAADNCSDRTAFLARAEGAQVLERHDPSRPGKPSAIAWALERLPLTQYHAVVIVDADTVVNPSFASALAAAAPLTHKAVQPYNDVANPKDNALTRMAALFATARYRYAFRLKRRAGLNVPLSAGMCIGSEVLRRNGWKAFSLCEDWECYAQLCARGVPIHLAPRARLYAQETRSLRQSASQRQRWTAGKLMVLLREGPALWRSRQVGLRQKLDALAELSAPGPALHLGLVAVLVALTRWLDPPGGGALVLVLASSLARPALYALAALRLEPEFVRSLAAFAFLPCYVVWRLMIGAGALRLLGQRPWIRTARHAAHTVRLL